MKHHWIISFACLGGLAATAARAGAQEPFTYETPAEFSSTGDFNGDGRPDLVLFDRATGAVRALVQTADGGFEPGEAQFTGLEAVEALAVGRLGAGSVAQQAVFGSPRDHRVVALGVGSPGWEEGNLNGLLSPAALAVVEPIVPEGELPLGGTVYVATEQNDLPDARRLTTARQQFNGLQVSPTGVGLDAPLRRGNGVRWRRDVAPVAAFVAATGADASAFRVFPGGAAPTAPPPVTAPDLPAEARWTYGFFAPLRANPAFLFYERRGTGFTTRQGGETDAQTYDLTDAGTYDLGRALHLLMTVTYENKAWLLALFEEGSSAGLYEFDATGAPTQRQQWNAPPGEKFTTAAALGEGGFLLLSGAGGRSANWHRFDYDGSRHRRRLGGSLAPLHSRLNPITLFLYNEEPMVRENALLYEMRRLRDWTTDATPLLNGVWSVESLLDAGLDAGLGQPETSTLTLPGFPIGERGQQGVFPVVNQMLRPAAFPHDRPVSVATFSPRLGPLTPRVLFDPPPGEYPTPLAAIDDPDADPDDPDAARVQPQDAALEVTLTSTGGSGAGIKYRFSEAEGWRDYDGQPLRLTQPVTSIYAYSVNSYPTAGARSSVATGVWRLRETPATPPPTETPPAEDANGNGLSDDWERAFNQHDPSADPDGDGRTNLEEYLAGTDPLDPGDVPVQPARPRSEPVLAYQVVEDEGTPCLELSWDREHADAELQYSADMLHWQTLREGIEFTPEGCRALVPLDTPVAAGYFRLERR